MRRIFGLELLVFALVAVFVPGCSDSPSPQVADVSEVDEAPRDAVLPESARAANPGLAENVGGPFRPADPIRPVDISSVPVQVADGEDSDTPRPSQPRGADQPATAPPQYSYIETPLDDTIKSAKGNKGRADGDDPQAQPVIQKVAKNERVDPSLDNGREPTAKPVPEALRVAVKPTGETPELRDEGRRPGAKPGDEAPRPDPVSDTPAKPATPSRATLAELSEAIQTLDKDKDGQIGLYEWPTAKLAEFKALDANDDGFLSPTEILSSETTGLDGKNPTTGQASTENNAKTDTTRTDSTKTDSTKTDSAKTDSAKTDSAKTDSAKTDAVEKNPAKEKEGVQEKEPAKKQAKEVNEAAPVTKPDDQTAPPAEAKTPAGAAGGSAAKPDEPRDKAAPEAKATTEDAAATEDGAGSDDKPTPGS